MKDDTVSVIRGTKTIKVEKDSVLLTMPVSFLESLVKILPCTMKREKNGTATMSFRIEGESVKVRLIHAWKTPHVRGVRGRHQARRSGK